MKLIQNKYFQGFCIICFWILVFLGLHFLDNWNKGCFGIDYASCCGGKFIYESNVTCCNGNIYKGTDWLRCGNECYKNGTRPDLSKRVRCGEECCQEGFKCCPIKGNPTCYNPSTHECRIYQGSVIMGHL